MPDTHAATLWFELAERAAAEAEPAVNQGHTQMITPITPLDKLFAAAGCTTETEKRAAVIAKYGSQGAAEERCERESILEEAVEHLARQAERTAGGTTYTVNTLDGWGGGLGQEVPESVLAVVAAAYPVPTTLREARDQWHFWVDRDTELGYLLAEPGEAGPHTWLDLSAYARQIMVGNLYTNGPINTLDDLRVRLEYLAEDGGMPPVEVAQSVLDGFNRLVMADTATSTPIPAIGMTFAEAAAKILQLVHEEDTTPGGDEANEHRDALHDEWSALRDAVFDTPPETAADVVAILDILLHPSIGLPSAMIRDEEVQAVQRLRDLLATDLTAGQRGSAANDTPDAFAAALSILDTKAAGPLCMPQVPSDAMSESGAAAAGITTEQFRSAYAAAADAFQRERAA